MRGGVEVDRVDVGDETAHQSRLRVVGQRERRHGRPEVRPADADVDHGVDPPAGGAGPRSVADALRELPHLRQHRVHVAGDVLPVDDELAAGRQAQGHVQDGPVLRRVDVLAGEHRVAMLLDPRRPGDVHEETQGLVGDPVLGVVEDEVGPLCREPGRPFGVLGEELAQVALRHPLVVRPEGLPLRCRRRVHARQSTGPSAVPRPTTRNETMAGSAAGSCTKKRCPPSNISSCARGDGRSQEFAVGRRGDAVEAAAADEGRARDRPEAGGGVVPGAGGELVGQAGFPPPGRGAPARWIISAMSGCARRQPASQRESRSSICLIARSSGSRSTSSCSGKEAPPAPPADVQARTSRRTCAGCPMASSWATIPPKETPRTRQSSQPTRSRSAAASSAKSAMA